MVRVTYQGEPGAYSEQALLEYFEARGMRGTEPVPCLSFDDAVRQVEEGEAHYAFLPIENTLEGTVQEAVDVLLTSDLYIAGEMRFKVHHCLITHPGATLETVQRVYSHPYALRQCRDFLNAQRLKTIPTSDTAGAVREIKQRGDILEAAIASEKAAQVHNMQVLQKGIQSREHNYTRFIALAKSEYKPNRARKETFMTTVVFGARHAPGALYDALGVFQEANINLYKLESRPRPDRPWTYHFLVDFEGHREDKPVAHALAQLLQRTSSLQVLGSYPTWDSVKEQRRSKDKIGT